MAPPLRTKCQPERLCKESSGSITTAEATQTRVSETPLFMDRLKSITTLPLPGLYASGSLTDRAAAWHIRSGNWMENSISALKRHIAHGGGVCVYVTTSALSGPCSGSLRDKYREREREMEVFRVIPESGTSDGVMMFNSN